MSSQLETLSAAPPHATEQRSLLQEGVHDITSLVWGDSNSALRNNVEQLGTEAIKAVPLFMIGSKSTYAATALLYGLDQVHTGTGLQRELVDFGTGAAKGALTKGAFQMIGQSQLGIAGKGVLMGASSRILDGGLTPSTYYDANGKFDLLGGLEKTGAAAANPTALATDAVVFGVAHGLFKGLNATTSGALERSPFFTTVATGGTYGFVSGAGSELQRERSTGEKFNFGKIALNGLEQAGVMSVAAAPGGFQMARSINMANSEVARTAAPTDNGSNPISLRNRISDLIGFRSARNVQTLMGAGDTVGKDGAVTRTPLTESTTPIAFNKSGYVGEGDEGIVYDNGNGTVTKVFTDPARDAKTTAGMFDYLDSIGVKVPRVHEFGKTADGRQALVMDMVGDGDNLQTQLLLGQVPRSEYPQLSDQYSSMAKKLQDNNVRIDWQLKNMIWSDGQLH
ncbi:MAG: hypothetical protein ACRD3W_24210, partial [Terriglobales bacterium]